MDADGLKVVPDDVQHFRYAQIVDLRRARFALWPKQGFALLLLDLLRNANNIFSWIATLGNLDLPPKELLIAGV